MRTLEGRRWIGAAMVVAGSMLHALAGTWSSTGDMGTGRSSHSATLLQDGTVLVAGGHSGTSAISSAEIYDPTAGTWRPTGGMGDARGGHVAVLLLDGRVLVVGGGDALPGLRSAELYDPATGTWSTTGALAFERSLHTATRLANGMVLVAGGTTTTLCELYEPSTATWSITGAISTMREESAAALLADGRVLLAGGISNFVELDSVELYEPSTGAWSPTGSLREPRFDHTATTLASGLVLIAGDDTGQNPRTELYDPASGTWRPAGDLNGDRFGHAQVRLTSGMVLVAGGYDLPFASATEGMPPIGTAELFDPATETWFVTGSMSEERYYHTATLLSDGRVLVAAGTSGSVPLASAEIYDPTSCVPIALSPGTLPPGVEGTPYSQTISAGGGAPPYAFTVTGGALPTGLSLDGSGLLSGTPTAAATFGFTVTATDSTACSGSLAYSLTVTGSGGMSENLLAGEGLGPTNPNRVKAYRQDGTTTPVDFLAYGAGTWGTNVAAGATRGVTTEEIVTGPGPGDVFGPQVRAFDASGAPLAKVSFFAYGTLKFGVNVGTGELEADGFDEILSGAGPGAVFGPHVRGWNFDGLPVVPFQRINFFAYGTLKYGVNVACGDVDRDLVAEILTGAGPAVVFDPQVRGFNYDGGSLGSISKINFNAFPLSGWGANVASGDLEADGFAEIAAGPGPGPTHPYTLVGFDFDGGPIAAIPGFTATIAGSLYGARIGVGDVTGDGTEDATGGAGRDPAAPSTVRPFIYVSGSLSPLLTFEAFPGSAYGVNVTGGAHGH